MLVHMTPGEVGGLQALARAAGGSLTTNPETGLPEAGFLSNILPTILGIGLAATGVGAPLAAGIVGAGATAVTGDLGKGLMAGLGAFGGAGLAGATGLGGSISKNAFGALSDKAGILGSNMGAGAAAETLQPLTETLVKQPALDTLVNTPVDMAGVTLPTPSGGAMALGNPPISANVITNTVPKVQGTLVEQVAKESLPKAIPDASSGFLGKFGKDFGATVRQGLPGGFAQKVAPYLAGYGVLEPLMRPPEYKAPESDEPTADDVPRYGALELDPRIDPRYPRGEISFFRNNPALRMAKGDEVPVMDSPTGTPAVTKEAVPAAGLGATLAAQLPQFTQQFQTSPGPISGVPFGYGEGQSPSEQIRASMLAAAEAEPEPQRPPPIANPFGNLIGGSGSFDLSGLSGVIDTGALQDYLASIQSGGGLGGLNIPSGVGGAPINQTRAAIRGGMSPMPETVPMPDVGPPLDIQSGGFVMPARETAEFGNGSTMAGQNVLASMGGVPINGAGDGVSDSIPAMIDGDQPAALASGETYFPPQAVEAMGGADQMRRMMEQAQRSRENASRGGENRLPDFDPNRFLIYDDNPNPMGGLI